MNERLKLLFQKYIDNSCTEDELQEMFTLINIGESEKVLRELISGVYQHGTVTPNLLPVVDASGKLIFGAPPVLKRKRTKRAMLVAALLIAAVSSIVWYNKETDYKPASQARLKMEKRSTEVAESRHLVLPDSTHVWLNAGSSLEYPKVFGKEQRVVYLKGEAFFDVQHAENYPFIIHTGDVATHVLGTAFNVKAYPGEKNITVSVSRGKVQVSRKHQVLATLLQGQQVKVEEQGARVVQQNIQGAGVGAWQKGQLVYQDETFKDILSDLERLYDVSIRMESGVDQEVKVSATFQRDIGVEQALLVLCKLTDRSLVRTATGFNIE